MALKPVGSTFIRAMGLSTHYSQTLFISSTIVKISLLICNPIIRKKPKTQTNKASHFMYLDAIILDCKWRNTEHFKGPPVLKDDFLLQIRAVLIVIYFTPC